MKLEGKTALVTGGSRGIGRAIALRLAQEGADVAINYAGNKEAADSVIQEVEELGKKAMAIQADVSNPSAVEEMVKQVLEAYGRLDILVNNAGITRDNLLMRMKEEDWNQVIDVNLKGAFNCTKAVMRQMMRQKAGRIINITSISGVLGTAGQANYAAAKAGLIAMTKTTAREMASRGITVNAVAPGFIKTEMTDVLADDYKQELLEQIPLGRLGDPDDIAQAVSFLASDQAAYITGQTLHVNGGMFM